MRTARSVPVGDDQRAIVNGLEELIVGAHFPHAVTVGKVPFGSVGIGVAQHAADLLQADAILVQHGRDSVPPEPRAARLRPQ